MLRRFARYELERVFEDPLVIVKCYGYVGHTHLTWQDVATESNLTGVAVAW